MRKIFPVKSRIVLVGLIMLFCSVMANAQDKNFKEKQLTVEGRNAFQKLMTASTFEDTYIGEGGVLSEYIKAYRVLLEEKKRVGAFKLLLEKATIAGKLYALCGLFDTNHTFFLKAVENFKNSEEEVMTQSGCTLGREKVKSVVFNDSRDTIRLKNPLQTMEDWRKSVGISENWSYSIDIYGGGYSLNFRKQSWEE